MNKVLEFFKNKKWKTWKKDQWLILFLAGILLLVIAVPANCGGSLEENGGNASASGGDSAAGADSTASAGSSELADYEERMETRLEEALALVDGVGRVEVMMTFSDAGESVVEKDRTYSEEQSTQAQGEETTTDDRTESSEATVYDDSGDGTPFVSKQNVPTVAGVLVVAEGGGKKSVASDISDVVEALFGLEAHKIKVVEMNQIEEDAE